MPFSVLCRGEVIGYSDLESVDSGMGLLLGRFAPTPGYAAVAGVFQQLARLLQQRAAGEAQLQAYYRARDALGLELRDTQGRAVRATLTVYDYGDEAEGQQDRECELEVVVADRIWFAEELARRGPAPLA